MTDHELRRENSSLRLHNADLLRRTTDAEQALEAFAHGEVDAVALSDSSTPVLLRMAQENLRGSKLLLRAIFDSALDPMVLANHEGTFVDANPAACALYELPLSQLVGRPVAGLAGPHSVSDAEQRTFRTQGYMRGTFSLQRSAGGARALEYGWVSDVTPGLDLAVLRDVTDQIAAQDALRRSEARYRRIVESTSDGIWMYNAKGVTTFMNRRMAAMLACSVEDAIGQPVTSFVAPERRADARNVMARRTTGAAMDRFDFPLRRKDGTELLARIAGNALFDAEGRFEAGIVLVSDISAERLADEMRARLAAIVESSEDAIIAVGLDGVITSWNRGAESLYQHDADETLGRSVLLLIPPEAQQDELGVLLRVAKGEAVGLYETKRHRKDGTIVEVAVTVSPILDAGGIVIGVSEIAHDLTKRRQTETALRRTEEQFRQAQKMEAVGRLAAGVAHDFNNLLSVVLGFSRMGADSLKPGDPLRDDLTEIQTAGERAAELTRQLLAFSRQQVLQPSVVDINQIVGNMERMLARLLGEDVEVTWAPERALGRILVDPGQIEQVVMNLAVNARDAMPEGGKLVVETANVELDADYVTSHLGVATGHYVMLAISDNGIGMDAATRARIFEPFFTTKEVGKGTGLGLATVFGIVQQSDGHIWVYSEPGRGSTFKVYFPRTDRVSSPASLSGPTTVLRGTETILLVEDEAQVRAVACAILRRNGYHVLDTMNGGEAFLVSKDFPATIHLLLTDVVMPRMSGRKVAEQLAQQRPEMKVLFASGYTDDAIVHHGVLDAGVHFLQKPFTPDALLRKVREVLDSG